MCASDSWFFLNGRLYFHDLFLVITVHLVDQMKWSTSDPLRSQTTSSSK